LPEWSGIDVPLYRTVSATFRWKAEESRACDYDRACDVSDYAGVITVGFGEGLVLNDAPCATAWLPTPSGGILARWEYADSDSAMESTLASIPDGLQWEPKGMFRIVGSPQVLFNSGEPGVEQLQPRLTLQIPVANYNVLWARFAPNAATAAGLVQLRNTTE
jgi:hypothetical protein